MPINYTVANDARPHVSLLLTATAISVGLWVVSWFVPIAGYLVYPIQLFATFIHESSHALVAFLTGNSVLSLTVSPDTSGMVWSQSSGFSSLLISSAGYLGTTAFGLLLAVWMRYGFASRLALFLCSGLIAVMTAVFGFVTPFWNLLANVSFVSVVFTVVSGAFLAACIFAIAKFATPKWVNFALAFLAVQCLLNSFLSLKTLFVVTASSDASSDALNMANATGIPAIVWVVLWIIVSLIMMSIGVRLYASRKTKATDSVFVD